MKLRKRRDGGATIRLSKVELVTYYNLLNQFVEDAERDPDVDDQWILPHRERLRVLAAAIGRPSDRH